MSEASTTVSNMCSTQARELVLLAADGLVESAHEPEAARRYVDAHVAALRAAAAIVADRSAGSSGAIPHSRVANVWQVLARTAPEFAEWAALFDVRSAKRSAVQSGAMTVTTREADDCLRDAASFVSRVADRLGLGQRQIDVSTQWLVAT